MPYMIDGHNLIPKIPSLSLEELDDEIRLVQMLQLFCQRRNKQVVVYFDKGQPGQPRIRSFGAVTAHFVREGRTADQAIHAHLKRLAGEAHNWTVVSSDQRVQSAARASRAQTLHAEEFSRLLTSTIMASADVSQQNHEQTLSPQELDEWLTLFNEE